MRRITLLLLAVFLVVAANAQKQPKYIFYFIGDGMGHNHIALTEATLANAGSRIGFDALSFTTFPVVGFSTTHSTNRQTTDSAAAGTALATGEKTSVGTIGMNADHSASIFSVANTAMDNGYLIGITSSVSIDHATPASFFAHEPKRNMSYEIGTWMTKTGFDLYASSGLLKPSEGRSLYGILEEKGYKVIRGSEQDLKGYKIYWEQDVDYDPSALPLAIDRKKEDMSLPEITEKSMVYLFEKSKDKKAGFFLMVEGGQIDWASHDNDAASIVHETYDFAQSIEVAYEFYKKRPKETLIVVTADHETGGLALGRGDRGYDTNFDLLLLQKMSKGKLRSSMKNTTSWEEAKELLKFQLGFWNKINISAKEELQLLIAYEEKPESTADLAINILHKRAGVSFTSGAHTSAYVPVFAIGVGSELFNGRTDNTDIPKILNSLVKSNSDKEKSASKGKGKKTSKKKKK